MDSTERRDSTATAWRATLSAGEALALLGYLLCSAELCLDDPPLYGSFRLLDAGNRFLGMLLGNDALHDDTVLRQLKEQIDLKKDWLMYDQDGYRAFVREVPVLLAGYLKGHAGGEMVSDGPYGRPPARILICTDVQRCRAVGLEPWGDRSSSVDVGTALMNMLLVAQDLSLGACPVTSFSQGAVAVLLDLPERLIPALMVLVGHAVPRRPVLRPGARTRLTVEDLTLLATPDRGLQPLSLGTRP